MSTIKSEYISHIDNTGTPNITMNDDGSTGVKGLSNGDNNLPIHRGSIDPAQVQSFQVQDNDANNWYPFNPIPTWCSHVRYDINLVLSTNALTEGGLYFRWGSAAGPLLAGEVSAGGEDTSVLENGPGIILYRDPLLLRGNASQIVYYDYVMDFYFYNRGIGGGDDFFCYGIGRGAQTPYPAAANVSNARMTLQHIIPQSPNTIQPDRMGVLFFGGAVSEGQNIASIKQTFMTDGPVGFSADLGPTPTPI